MLNVVEIRYWFTKLKMCDLMWVIRRVRHIIKVSISFTIVYIDHVVNTFIARQTILNFVNTNKFNLRLIRASIYLSQFRLNVKHRSNKKHVISNVFSRLFFDNKQASQQINFENALNFDTFHNNLVDSSNNHNVYALQKSLVVMFDDFRKQITNNYIKKKVWRNIIKMLKALAKRVQIKEADNAKQKVAAAAEEVAAALSEAIVSSDIVVSSAIVAPPEAAAAVAEFVDQQRFADQQRLVDSETDEPIFKKLRTDINFQLASNDIIYHIEANISRSCISSVIKKKIFQLTHNENQHAEIHKNYERIADILYISRLSRKLRRYIEHCFNCQLTQIKRHRFYDELMLVSSSPHFFHIIIMNFVINLSKKLNAILNVTCKFFKRVIIITNKIIYNVNQWTHLLFERFLTDNWNISMTIIFDRDSKFLFNM